MKPWRKEFCAFAILATFLVVSVPALNVGTSAVTEIGVSQVNGAIGNAYVAVYESQVQGHANISGLVAQLNNATQLVNLALAKNATNPTQASGDLLVAMSIARQVGYQTGAASGAGAIQYKILGYKTMGEIAAIAASAALAYFLSTLLYGRWWSATHRHNYVALKRIAGVGASGGRNGVRTRGALSLSRRERKWAGVGTLAALATILAFASLQAVFNPFPNTQGNAQLGVLGPTKMTNDYPTNVALGQLFVLHGYLANQEGTPRYYSVQVKQGDPSTPVSNATSSGAPLIARFYFVLNGGQTVVFPMNLSMSSAGPSQRLIFELWSYEHTDSSWGFVYTGIFNQIWLNVTSGPRGN
jgi:hypothetical protein